MALRTAFCLWDRLLVCELWVGKLMKSTVRRLGDVWSPLVEYKQIRVFQQVVVPLGWLAPATIMQLMRLLMSACGCKQSLICVIFVLLIWHPNMKTCARPFHLHLLFIAPWMEGLSTLWIFANVTYDYFSEKNMNYPHDIFRELSYILHKLHTFSIMMLPFIALIIIIVHQWFNLLFTNLLFTAVFFTKVA